MIITRFSPPATTPCADVSLIIEKTGSEAVPREVPAVPALVKLLEKSTKSLNRCLENMLKCPPGMFEVRSQMAGKQVEQYAALTTQCLQSLTLDQRQRLFERSLQNMPVPAEISDDFNAGVKSSSDFFDKLLELIDLIKNGYLAGYEHIIKAYSDFFADFNAEITAKLKDWIKGVNEGKEVELQTGPLRAALEKLLQKYSHPNPAAVLFPKPGEEGASREQAEKWREALGLPASCLKQNADGTWCVVMDMSPLHIMKNELPTGEKVTWDTAKFQFWQTGFNAQEERMKNMLQSLTQKYSNANAYHDNFNKTLSSHLNQFADMLKAMLNF